MWIVTSENGISLANNGHPLGIRCHCGHRALIPQGRIPERIGGGSITRLRSLRWKCSQCSGRRIELLLFRSTYQALAFMDDMSYAGLWDIRLHGYDISEEPYCREALKPNPYTDGDPEIPDPVLADKGPVNRWKVA